MARISTISTGTPASTSKLVGNIGSTTYTWDIQDMPGIIPSTAGTSGQVLQTTGGIPTWVDQSDLTGTPDLSTGHITTAGTSGQVLQTTGGAAAWVNVNTLPGVLNSTIDPSTGHITTAGTSGQILQTTGGAAVWKDQSDLVDPSTGHITTAGTSGQILKTTGGAATWVGMTSGSLLYGNTSGEVVELGSGSSGEFLGLTTGVPTWMDLGSGNLPTTVGVSSGSLVNITSGGVPGWLAPGTSGQVLQTSGGLAVWKDQSDLTGTPDPSTGHITTAGTSGQVLQTTGGVATWVDSTSLLSGASTGSSAVSSGALFYGSSINAKAELAIGTSGQVLQSTGGVPTWVAQSDLTGTPDPSTGHITTAGTSGQILQTTGGTASWEATSAVLADIGVATTAGGKLVAKSSVSAGWIDDDWSVSGFIDGAGSDITTGVKGVIHVPWAAGIENVEIQANTTVSSASFAIDFYVDDHSSTPASSGSKITGADPPTISSGSQRSSGITSSWTTAIVANDYVTVDVIDASSGITWASFMIKGRKLSTI